MHRFIHTHTQVHMHIHTQKHTHTHTHTHTHRHIHKHTRATRTPYIPWLLDAQRKHAPLSGLLYYHCTLTCTDMSTLTHKHTRIYTQKIHTHTCSVQHAHHTYLGCLTRRESTLLSQVCCTITTRSHAQIYPQSHIYTRATRTPCIPWLLDAQR